MLDVRTRGLCEGIALDLTAKRAWNCDGHDPAFVFAMSYGDLREALALGREVRAVPNVNNIHGRAAQRIRAIANDVKARLANWQPNDRERERRQ